jgi:glycerol-3-phosphate dehydrogenase
VATAESAAPDACGKADEYDLIVVGGGINGAGIAREAAGQDLRVCLIEQHDLASHTSSASTKLIHGGLRYLEQGELRLVREALAERERLLAIAPHIIRPMRFVLPYVDGLRPRWLLRLGLFVYDHAGARERLAASGAVALGDSPLGAPLNPSLHDGFEYSDCWVDDSRLVVLNAVDAAERGATVMTRATVTDARDVGGHWVVHTRDAAGTRRRLRARALVNATGAWVNEVLGSMQVAPRQQLRLVQGSHLILRRLYEGDHAYLLQSADRRVVFMIPYQRDYTLVGTTDVPYSGDPARPHISETERDYLLACINRFLRQPAGLADIRGSYSGVRPLYDSGEATAQKVSRDYHLELQRGVAGAPVLSVYGGKITTYRRLAEHAFALLAPALGLEPQSWTSTEPLPGGDMPEGDLPRFIAHVQERFPALPAALIDRLAHAYGTRVALLLGDARQMKDLGGDFGSGLTEAEVRYLVRHEWARSAEDILWRRTRLGLALPDSVVHDLQDAVAKLLG